MPFRSAATDPLKLWILTAVAEDRECFVRLVPPNADRRMNMSFPNVPVADLVDASLELLQEGLITAFSKGRKVRPDRKRLGRWFKPRRWLRRPPYYGLTPAGGLLW